MDGCLYLELGEEEEDLLMMIMSHESVISFIKCEEGEKNEEKNLDFVIVSHSSPTHTQMSSNCS